MKKLLSGIIVLVMILGFTLSFASCVAIPELDLRYAERALEKEDYTVYYSDDADDLDPGVTAELYARSYDGDEYLTITVFKTAKLAKLKYQSLNMYKETAIKGVKHDIKTLEYMLKKFDKDLSRSEINKLNDELEELYETLENLEKNYSFGINGKIVWEGTPDAIKDSRDK